MCDFWELNCKRSGGFILLIMTEGTLGGRLACLQLNCHPFSHLNKFNFLLMELRALRVRSLDPFFFGINSGKLRAANQYEQYKDIATFNKVTRQLIIRSLKLRWSSIYW